MNEELLHILEEVKERLMAIKNNERYAYARFAREQEFLRGLVTDIPGAMDKRGIYHNPFVEYGYRQSDSLHRETLIRFCKSETIRSIEEIMEMEMAVV